MEKSQEANGTGPRGGVRLIRMGVSMVWASIAAPCSNPSQTLEDEFRLRLFVLTATVTLIKLP